MFYRDRSVLYVSLHQEYWYPGTGDWEETGEGEGVGFTVNIPLPAGTGDDGYRVIFEEVVVPLIKASAPQLIIISAGYDAHYGDPLGGMLLTAPGFRSLTEMVLRADGHAGRVAAILEGGYDLTYLGNSVLATLEALTGRPPHVDDRPSRLTEVAYSTIRARARKARSIVRTDIALRGRNPL
jgi:acetoin utilization deacetylase AcuC-like enzyme